ncbi:discoidin domain-containing protein [Paenibacillus sp. HJGM_3]|uniref:discoidin domain-containing protein n=1 Tax=Paenibacillus sp. HJGM_3 TaxID=3379816 RepID=UPI0038581CF5
MKTTRLLAKILAVSLVFSLFTGIPLHAKDGSTVVAAVNEDVNLAKGKTVFASSSYETANTGKKFLVDGIRSTTKDSFGWSSDVYNTSSTKWVWATVDLDSSYIVSRVDLYPRDDGQYAGNNFPVNFELKVSSDNENWTVVKQISNYPINPKGVQSFSFDPVRARFVRVEGLGIKTWIYGMQLAEMEVYGNPSSRLGVTNGIHADGKLTVQVGNSSGEPLTAEFNEWTLVPAQLGPNGLSGFENTQTMQLPDYYPQEYGDASFSPEALAQMADSDNVYHATNSKYNSPYQRFDVQFDEPVGSEIYVTWEGRTDQVATLYVWDFATTKWKPLESRESDGSQDVRILAKIDPELVQGQKAHFMVAATQKNIAEPAKKPAENEYDFSFVWETDTQYYSQKYPNIFETMNRWIADNKDAKKIKYVIHTGDLVQNWNQEDQWQVADQSMKILEGAGIPYGVVSGNHDVNHLVNDYEYYWKYFGRDRFAGKPGYGGDMQNNRHHYDLISAGGMDFVILYLGVYGRIDQPTIDWANGVLSQYKDRYAIVGTHVYIDAAGKYGLNGKDMMEKIVAPNENVIMTVNGHYHGAFYNVKRINGKVVYEVMSDYQEGPEGGQGYIRLLQFDAKNKRMYMNTYSPYKDDYNFFADDLEQATFPLDAPKGEMSIMTDQFQISTKSVGEPIGTVSPVTEGPVALELDPDRIGKEADGWFVKLTDSAGNVIKSDIWRFQERSGLYSATVDGTQLILNFDRPLSNDSQPDPQDFQFYVENKPTVVSAVYVEGSRITLTLAKSVPDHVPDQKAIAVSYTPGSKPLRDYAGYRVEPFVNFPVRHISQGPGRTK